MFGELWTWLWTGTEPLGSAHSPRSRQTVVARTLRSRGALCDMLPATVAAVIAALRYNGTINPCDAATSTRHTKKRSTPPFHDARAHAARTARAEESARCSSPLYTLRHTVLAPPFLLASRCWHLAQLTVVLRVASRRRRARTHTPARTPAHAVLLLAARRHGRAPIERVRGRAAAAAVGDKHMSLGYCELGAQRSMPMSYLRAPARDALSRVARCRRRVTRERWRAAAAAVGIAPPRPNKR